MAEQPERPTGENREEWTAYWTILGMPWRTEPEIDMERQRYLAELRAITPDIEHGVYPFRDVPLTRADLEWLLANHRSGDLVGPVDWQDKRQRTRAGLDMRGANFSHLVLDDLPLAGLCGGLSGDDWARVSPEVRDIAGVCMEGTYLRRAHLEGAILRRACLEGADFLRAHLEGADFRRARLQGTDFGHANLTGASLRGAYLSQLTRCDQVTLAGRDGVGPQVADVDWGGMNLAVVDWAPVKRLGDEQEARTASLDKQRKTKQQRLEETQTAVRANRQFAKALREESLHEDATRFAYRAQMFRRRLMRRQGHPLRYMGALLLELIAGYGYRPLRSFATYLIVLLGFAATYFVLTNFAITPFLSSHSSPLVWQEAIVLSVSSFHGRGLFPSGLSLGDPIAILAAFEAIIGLLIEITFIATFTQRFFAR